MTDIEDAIQAMENLNMVLSITDSERHAANLAIQALKEKAEREKGCEYCNAYKNIATIDYGETQIIVDLNGDNIRIFDNETPGICENNKIKYCPMCGRKLGE